MLRNLEIFLDDHVKSVKQKSKVMIRIQRKLEEIHHDASQIKLAQFNVTAPPPIIQKNIFSKTVSFLDINEIEIARQLTIREHKIYKKIKPYELLNQSWNKEKLKHRAKHIIEITERFNILSNWVSVKICKTKTLKKRKNVMLKMINIAKSLFELNNFSSLMAFLSALQNAGVSRLNFTKEEIPRKTNDELQNIFQILKNDKSYKELRIHLKKCVPPLVPFLGVYLTDLTFIDDGNPDFIQHKKTKRNLINWTKRVYVNQVFQTVRLYQVTPYNLSEIQELFKNRIDTHKYVDGN
jgi:hypothetical protein